VNIFDSEERFLKYTESDTHAINRMLTNAILDIPFLALRLGDGEAKLLAYPDYLDYDSLSKQLRIWFGDHQLTHSDVLHMKELLLAAISQATILGLPGYHRCTNSKNGVLTNDAHNCQLLWQVLIDNFGLNFLKRKAICSANVHHTIQQNKNIKKLVNKYSSLGFVYWNHEVIRDIYLFDSLTDICFIRVPSEKWSRNDKTNTHYPHAYRDVMRRIKKQNYDGFLFLVGAGLLGKIYAFELYKNGASVLDFGAVLDGWSDSIPSQREGMVRKRDVMTLDYLFK
jgi:hypothetical protein